MAEEESGWDLGAVPRLDWIVRRKYVLVPELVRAVNRCGSTHGVPLPRAAGLTVVEYSYCRWRIKYPSCTSTDTGTDQRAERAILKVTQLPEHSTAQVRWMNRHTNQTDTTQPRHAQKAQAVRQPSSMLWT